MRSIIFENKGEIDRRLISTFGCSVKESSNPIGFFGTGLKYAVAVLLRKHHKVVLQTGAEQIEFTSRPEVIRGKRFEFVLVDGDPCGFTTELGKTWEVWMAYRELYCNAKDEPESVIAESDEIPLPVSGKTRLIVTGDEFARCHVGRHEFILESLPAYKCGDIEIHTKPSQHFFYRGIRVMTFANPALFTYNATGHIDLTEDRTVKEPHHIAYMLARNILRDAPREVLDRILIAPFDKIEHSFDFHGWSGTTPSQDFFDSVSRIQRDNIGGLNRTALRVWREQKGGVVSPRRIQLTNVQFEMLERALEFCSRIGFQVRGEYPIIVAETLGEDGLLAIADREGRQIILSERIFNTGGTKGVARALLEEYMHLKYNFNDESRAFQNFLFDKMISLGEELKGEPI